MCAFGHVCQAGKPARWVDLDPSYRLPGRGLDTVSPALTGRNAGETDEQTGCRQAAFSTERRMNSYGTLPVS